VQAAFNELQAQNHLLSARAANKAQEAATFAMKLEAAQAEIVELRAALEEAQGNA